MIGHYVLAILGLFAIAGIVHLFVYVPVHRHFWWGKSEVDAETIIPILLAMLAIVYLGWTFGVAPILNTRQYHH